MEKSRTTRVSEAIDALERAVGRLRGRFADGIEGSGVTSQQLKVLRILATAGDDGLPTLALGRALGEGSPGITRMVDRLERRGLVKRARDSQDRREVRCTITPAGLVAVQTTEDGLRSSAENAFASLTPHEVGALIHLVRRIK